jgi:predicted dehydrogenase
MSSANGNHKVAIIGCGLIGQKRAKNLGSACLAMTADTDLNRARSLAATASGAIATSNWRDVLSSREIDIVVVATPNKYLAEISLASLQANKHVLVEKPAACAPEELNPLISAAAEHGKLVRVGFNHRYHPALLKARELFDSGVLGELMFVRGRYGHGGRIGYDKEWRADPALSGGGELIDQGVHMIDLARWFLGDFSEVNGFAHTYFWNMPVDDNGFMLLKTARNQVAFLHVSCTEWKNMFSLEIYGRNAKLHVQGLGGSYGVERLEFYRMLPEMGPPETTIWEYPRGDDSWALEFNEFLEDIKKGRTPAANLFDAKAALEIVQKIYSISHH